MIGVIFFPNFFPSGLTFAFFFLHSFFLLIWVFSCDYAFDSLLLFVFGFFCLFDDLLHPRVLSNHAIGSFLRSPPFSGISFGTGGVSRVLLLRVTLLPSTSAKNTGLRLMSLVRGLHCFSLSCNARSFFWFCPPQTSVSVLIPSD